MKVQFLWFSDRPNHESARSMLLAAIEASGVDAEIADLDATDPEVANELRFPGSPTIRVNGVDVQPGFADPGDYTPRCRLYATDQGLQGVPKREWIDAALEQAARQ